MEDLRLESQAGRVGQVMTAAIVDGMNGKEYRLPTEDEIQLATEASQHLSDVFVNIPFGIPEEPTPGIAGRKRSSSSLQIYGLSQWRQLFSARQLLALGIFVKYTREVREMMGDLGYPSNWVEPVCGYLALAVDRIADRGSSICHWDKG